MNMKFKAVHEYLWRAGIVGVTVAAASIALPVFAQQPSPSAPQSVEKIEVTGSSIKRIEGESALPVTVITKADIDKSGATTAIELLQLVSANTSAGNVSFANVIGSATFSSQTASLRGLGGGRTLVLINGKRASGFAGEVNGVQGVNLAVVPFSAIDRVEVLKDGASAIYGSDAIGGVINFILRQDYRGGDLDVYYGVPTRGAGGKQQTVSGSIGSGNLATDKFNVLFSVSYNDQKHLDQRDRNFSNTSVRDDIGLDSSSSHTFPGRITTAGIGSITATQAGVFALAAPNNCAPSSLIHGRCRFDPSSYPGVNMIPDDKQLNLFGSARFQLDGGWQAYATSVYSRDETRYTIQPAPFSNQFPYGSKGEFSGAITLLPSSRFYPTAIAAANGVGGQPLDIRYRSVETGLRDTTDTNEGAQIVAGLKGAWLNWDWDGSYSYGEGKLTSHDNGGKPNVPKFQAIVNSGVVNFFGPNTPDIVAALRATNYIGDALKAKAKTSGFQGKTAGEIISLPAGPLAMAVGGEFRKETLAQSYAPELTAGVVAGYGGSFPSVNATRDIRAVFAEFNVPILKSLEGNVSFRNDHYSDFGSTTNPKVSLRWEPIKSLLIRGSYGKGFLAPSLYQLFTPPATTVTTNGVSDPIRCPVTHSDLDCVTQFGVTVGGNPKLRPEKSEQATAGIVFEPIRGLSFVADYFKVRLNNIITTGIPYTTILGDLATYGNLVTRAAKDSAFPNLPGHILFIDGKNINVGAQHIEGLDLEMHAKLPAQSWGVLRFDIAGTYFLRNDSQNSDGTYSGFIANQFGASTPGVVARWKHYASLTLDSGPWSGTLGNTFQTGYVDVNPDIDGNPRRVSAMSLWDIQGSYKGIKNLTLTLGVKNLLDTNPPATNQATTFQVGFDQSYYDPRARFVYSSVRYAFK